MGAHFSRSSSSLLSDSIYIHTFETAPASMHVVDYQHLDSYPPCQKQFCCPACRKSWVLRDGQGSVSAGDLNIPVAGWLVFAACWPCAEHWCAYINAFIHAYKQTSSDVILRQKLKAMLLEKETMILLFLRNLSKNINIRKQSRFFTGMRKD